MKVFLTVLIVLFSSNIYAETIVICSMERPVLSQKDGTGYYWDLLRAVFEEEGIKLEHSSAPFARCLRNVENQLVNGAVAAFKTQDRAHKFTYPKSRLNFSSYGLTYLKETSFDRLENIKGSVGVIRGYDFSAWLPSSLELTNLNDNAQAIKLLKLNRLDYHADDLQDMLFTLKQMGERPEQFVYKAFHTKDLYMLFTKDTYGRSLAIKFDKGLRKVFENGTLERLIKKHGLANSILADFK